MGLKVSKLRFQGLKLGFMLLGFCVSSFSSRWVVVKIKVPFWVPIIIRHLYYLGYPKRDPNFDNHPGVV